MQSENKDIELTQYVSPEGFVHPGIGCTSDTLDVMRKMVRKGVSPWIDYFEGLKKTRYASLKTIPKFVERITDNSHIADFNVDAQTAWGHAVMYVVTGDERYIKTPCEIISHYGKVTDFFPGGFTDSHIKLGRPVFVMCTAAEIMRSFVPHAVTKKMIDLLCENSIGQIVHKNLKHKDYFMNQHTYSIMGYLAYAILADDRKSYEEAVEWTLVNSKSNDPKGLSGSMMHQFRIVARNDKTGETVEPTLQVAEMGRDQVHAGGGIDNLLLMCKTMEYQKTKVDLKNGTVTDDENGISAVRFSDDRLIKAADIFAKYNMGFGIKWVPTYSMGKVTYDNVSTTWRGRLVTNGMAAAYYYFKGMGIDLEKEYPYLKAGFECRRYEQKKRARSGVFIETLHNQIFDFWIGLPEECAESNICEDGFTDKFFVAYNYADRDALKGCMPLEKGYDKIPFVRMEVEDEKKSIVIFSSVHKNTKIAVRTNNVLRLDIYSNEEYKRTTLKDTVYLPDTKGKWCYMETDAEVDDITFFEVSPIEGKATIDFGDIITGEKVFPKYKAENAISYVGNILERNYFEAVNAKYRGVYLPKGAEVDIFGGTLKWQTEAEGTYRLYIEAERGDIVCLLPINVTVCKNLSEAMEHLEAMYDSTLRYEKATYENLLTALKDKNLEKGESALKELKLLTPKMEDGSIRYCDICTCDNDTIRFMMDEDVYSFGGLWGEDKAFTMDFGETYGIKATKFGMLARDGFPIRVKGAVVFGSNDKESWTLLTEREFEESAQMQVIDVKKSELNSSYRYLKFFMPKTYYHIFELSELRIWGERVEF